MGAILGAALAARFGIWILFLLTLTLAVFALPDRAAILGV
jgi:hypothetical protein